MSGEWRGPASPWLLSGYQGGEMQEHTVIVGLDGRFYILEYWPSGIWVVFVVTRIGAISIEEPRERMPAAEVPARW